MCRDRILDVPAHAVVKTMAWHPLVAYACVFVPLWLLVYVCVPTFENVFFRAFVWLDAHAIGLGAVAGGVVGAIFLLLLCDSRRAKRD